MVGLEWGMMALAVVVLIAVLAPVLRGISFKPATLDAPLIATGAIHVTVWHKDELAVILDDFAAKSHADRKAFRVTRLSSGAHRIAWTRPIGSDLALYLVHYLVYPGDMHLQGRAPEAVAVIPVPQGLPTVGAATGSLAKVFVPAGDADQSGVHALLADGRAFRRRYGRADWEPIPSAKASALVRVLPFAIEP